jgi:hypothetical protein
MRQYLFNHHCATLKSRLAGLRQRPAGSFGAGFSSALVVSETPLIERLNGAPEIP